MHILVTLVVGAVAKLVMAGHDPLVTGGLGHA